MCPASSEHRKSVIAAHSRRCRAGPAAPARPEARAAPAPAGRAWAYRSGGRDRVDPYAVGCPLAGEVTDHADDSGLGRRVGRAGQFVAAVDRVGGRIHQHRAAGLLQMRMHGASQQERRSEIDVHDPVPVIQRNVHERPLSGDTHGVDHPAGPVPVPRRIARRPRPPALRRLLRPAAPGRRAPPAPAIPSLPPPTHAQRTAARPPIRSRRPHPVTSAHSAVLVKPRSPADSIKVRRP